MGETVSCCVEDRDKDAYVNRSSQHARPIVDSPDESAVTLRVIVVSDLRRVDALPHLKSLLREQEEQRRPGVKTVLVVAGDFLAPSPLSSFDKGMGIISLLNELPADFATWGDRDSMLCHLDAVRRTREFNGTWINTNMQAHESFATSQVDAATLELESRSGHHRRRVGLVGILADAPTLGHPRPFGGATIKDPWETLSAYKEVLYRDRRCDCILPVLHSSGENVVDLGVFEDFPVIVDAGVPGSGIRVMPDQTRLARPGNEGRDALIIDLTWAHPSSAMRPTCHAELVSLSAYPRDPEMVKSVARALGVLEPLRTAELMAVPTQSRPLGGLSSVAARRRASSLATLLLTHMREALNYDEGSLVSPASATSLGTCDCAVSWGSNFHGNRDYADSEHVSLDVLRNELDDSQELVVVPLPGRILRQAVEDAWSQAAGGNGDWLQTDDGVEQEQGRLKTVAGRSLDPERVYQVATLRHAGLLQCSSVAVYLEAHPLLLRNCHAGWPQLSLVLWFYSEKLWEDLWSKLNFQPVGAAEEAFRRLAKEPTANVEALKRSLGNMGGFETALNRFRHKTGRLGETRTELGDLHMRGWRSGDDLMKLPATAPFLGSSGSGGMLERSSAAATGRPSPGLDSKAWEHVGFKFGALPPATGPVLTSGCASLGSLADRDRLFASTDRLDGPRALPVDRPLETTLSSLGAATAGSRRPLDDSLRSGGLNDRGALNSSFRSAGSMPATSELLNSEISLKSEQLPGPARSGTLGSVGSPVVAARGWEASASAASSVGAVASKAVPATSPALSTRASGGLKVTVKGRRGTVDWDGRPAQNYVVLRWCDDNSLSRALRAEEVEGLPEKGTPSVPSTDSCINGTGAKSPESIIAPAQGERLAGL